MYLLNKPALYIKVLIFISQIVLLVGCGQAPSSERNSCDGTIGSCLVFNAENISLQINTSHLLVEHIYHLQFKTNKDIQKAFLVPVNMNMGNIPLVLAEDVEGYRAKLIFGLCAEPVMQWQLRVEFADQSHTAFSLTSYWSEEVFIKNQTVN